MKQTFIRLTLFILTALIICSCSKPPSNNKGRIMVLGLSSDGNYAVSTDMSRHAILWNIRNKTYKIIGSKINIYSAHFIKNTHNYMYQDDTNNKVIIANINGRVIKKFNPGFPTYGHIITKDLQTYFASDSNYNVYKIVGDKKQQLNVSYCRQDHKGKLYSGPATSACTDFFAAGKLLNLSLTNDETHLVGSGSDNIYIWHTKNGIGRIISKNNEKAFAIISPNSKYIVSGDASYKNVIFAINSGKIVFTPNFGYNPTTHQTFDTKYKNEENGWGPNGWIGRTTTIKFIDDNHYLVIFNMGSAFMQRGFHYAGLFELGKKKAIKYLNLLVPNKPDQPYPATQDYDRDQAIDTSPTAHILVIAQAHNNGILVYKYDPKAKTLKQIWAPTIT